MTEYRGFAAQTPTGSTGAGAGWTAGNGFTVAAGGTYLSRIWVWKDTTLIGNTTPIKGAVWTSAGVLVGGTSVTIDPSNTATNQAWASADLPSAVFLAAGDYVVGTLRTPGNYDYIPSITYPVTTAGPLSFNSTVAYNTSTSLAFPDTAQGDTRYWFNDVSVETAPSTVWGTSGSRYPTTVDTTVGTTWATTTNATGSTASTYATFTNTTSGGVGTIRLSGYAAQANTNGGVQPTSIDSVDVTVKCFVGTIARTASITVQLYSGTTAIGTPTALAIQTTPGTDQTVNLSGANCPTWAQLSDLRAQVVFTRAALTTANVFSLDYVGAAVNYGTAPTVAAPVGVARVFTQAAVTRAATY